MSPTSHIRPLALAETQLHVCIFCTQTRPWRRSATYAAWIVRNVYESMLSQRKEKVGVPNGSTSKKTCIHGVHTCSSRPTTGAHSQRLESRQFLGLFSWREHIGAPGDRHTSAGSPLVASQVLWDAVHMREHGGRCGTLQLRIHHSGEATATCRLQDERSTRSQHCLSDARQPKLLEDMLTKSRRSN